LFCDFEDETTTAGLFHKRTKSKSVPPRLLLMASFKRLASGARWSTISECAFVSVPVLRQFFVDKFAPYLSSDAYYSTHVYHPKTVDSIRATERAYGVRSVEPFLLPVRSQVRLDAARRSCARLRFRWAHLRPPRDRGVRRT
jgi:hypothetical protein